jgi:Fur family ferric uptake transcriptional regulator
MEVLQKSDKPLSADQVFFELKKREIRVNLSTVYRVLETLADKNLAVKLSIPGDSRTLYGFKRVGDKHYLICLGCNKMIPLNRCPLGNYEEFLAKETNFTISGHKLDIYGYCPECREKYAHKE